MGTQNFNDYMDRFEARLARYIPPRSTWTPVEEALHRPRDLFRIPVAQTEALQLEALRFAFTHHYHGNETYRRFCAEQGVSPRDISSVDDLTKIPLIPDRFFKEYPQGRDFAIWLGNICTGDLPQVVIKSQTPTFDEVVAAFKEAGMSVTYSSGTGGRHTVIPRDRRTYLAAQYAAAKTAATMLYPVWNYDGYGCLLMPNPNKTDIFAGKVASVYFDAVRHVHTAIDRQVSAGQMRMLMSEDKGLRSRLIRIVAKLASLRLVDKIVGWLEGHGRSGSEIILVGPPFLIISVMNRLQDKGRSLDLGRQAVVITGGGWKMYEDDRVPAESFRQQVEEVLGVPGNRCIDVYGMVEGNGWMVDCPEGHYLHVPHSFFKPLVLDDEFKPLDYGQAGRFAFLDAAAQSYPGFIITGDIVRLHERCPVCDRPGPVLEPEVRRATGEEMRGCAEEVRHMVAIDVGG